MSSELVRREDWEPKAKALVEQYAGFADAANLTVEEQITALSSIIPVAMQVMDEARDSIEAVRRENDLLKLQEVYRLLTGVLKPEAHERWMSTSIPALDNMTPFQLIKGDRVGKLLEHARKYQDETFS